MFTHFVDVGLGVFCLRRWCRIGIHLREPLPDFLTHCVAFVCAGGNPRRRTRPEFEMCDGTAKRYTDLLFYRRASASIKSICVRLSIPWDVAVQKATADVPE